MGMGTIEGRMRVKEDVDLENKVNELWMYVRNFRNSLDSERACRIIRQGFDLATSAAIKSIKPLVDEASSLREKLAAAAKEMTAIKKELREAKKANAGLLATVSDMRDELLKLRKQES